MAEGLGFAIARKRAIRKKRSRLSFIVSVTIWMIAFGVLITRPGTIFNRGQGATNSTIVTEITGQGGNPPNPFAGNFLFPVVSNFVQNEWFSLAFLGVLVVGGMVLAQSIRVSLRETARMNILESETRRAQGIQATQDAIRSIDDITADPRSRIIACYQHMIIGVSRLGIPVSPDQTARELERAIRTAFMLEGSAAHDLTILFEEARYSLHSLDEQDAKHARELLELIADELKTTNSNR